MEKNNKISKIESVLGYSKEIYNIKNIKKYAVLLLILEDDNELSFVFQVRNKQISQGGEISLPGGKFENEDITTYNTAIRETCEEMGIDKDNIEIIGKLDTFISHGNMLIDPYVGYTDLTINEFNVNKNEVESVFILPIDYFINNKPEIYKIAHFASPYIRDFSTNEKITLLPVDELNLPNKYSKKWNQYTTNIPFYKTDKGLIWGLTAQIILLYCDTIANSKK